jgi:hypothetical protein
VPEAGGVDVPASGPVVEEGVVPRRLSLPSYGLEAESVPESPAWSAVLPSLVLVALGLFAAWVVFRPWGSWLERPSWLGEALAFGGAGLLLPAALADLVARRGRGIDHLAVALGAAALAAGSWAGVADGTPQALATLAVYCAATVAERRWMRQRPAPLAALQGATGADCLVDWGGARGPLAAGLSRLLFWAPAVPLLLVSAALVLSGVGALRDWGSGWVPLLVGGGFAFLPWSLRHAALGLSGLARAAAAANVRFLDPASVERTARIRHVVFMYRGVVTRGRPEVVEFVNYSSQPDDVILDLVASAERSAGGSSLAEALLAFTQGRGAGKEPSTRLSRFWPGHGVQSTSARGEVWIGSRRMLLEAGVSTGPVEEDARGFERAGLTVLFVALGRRVHALVGLRDPVREEVAEAADRLHRAGIETHLFTGESRATAEQVAKAAKVRHVRPELTREERAREIQGLRELGLPVAVIGRPTDPAQVVSEADVTVALGLRDPQGFPCEIVAASEDPRVAVEAILASRRAVHGMLARWVAAGAVALLAAGLVVLGFLTPAAALGVTAFLALLPLLLGRRGYGMDRLPPGE